MSVDFEDRKLVPFSQLDFGEVFIFNNACYVKLRPFIYRNVERINAVGIGHDDMICLWADVVERASIRVKAKP